METINMFVCLISLTFPHFPEVCAMHTVESHGPDSDVAYCLAVQTAIDSNEEGKQWGAEIAFCNVFDPDRDIDRLNESDESMHGDVTPEEFECMTDSTVRC